MLLLRLVIVEAFAVRQHPLALWLLIAPKHLSGPFERDLSRRLEVSVQCFDLRFLPKIRDKVNNGVVALLEAVHNRLLVLRRFHGVDGSREK